MRHMKKQHLSIFSHLIGFPWMRDSFTMANYNPGLHTSDISGMLFIPQQKIPNRPGYIYIYTYFFKLLQKDFLMWDISHCFSCGGIEAFLDFVDDDVPFHLTHTEGKGPAAGSTSWQASLLQPQPSWSWKASTHFEEKEISLNDVVGNVQAYKLTNSEDRHHNFPNLLVQTFGSWNNSDLQTFSSMSPCLVWARANLQKNFAGKSTLCLPCPNRVGGW